MCPSHRSASFSSTIILKLLVRALLRFSFCLPPLHNISLFQLNDYATMVDRAENY